MLEMQIFVKHQIYKTMKKLQNNFTTPEQSKRLLELGVPAWTADGYRWDFSSAFGVSEDKRYSTSISVICYEYQRNFNDKLPCWSVGRLIEIYLLCAELNKPQMIFIKEDVLMMDRIINELCYMAESERLDFSKLEE